MCKKERLKVVALPLEKDKVQRFKASWIEHHVVVGTEDEFEKGLAD